MHLAHHRPQTTSTNDPAYDADLDIAEKEALAAIAAHVFAERMASPAWIEDAFGELTHENYTLLATLIATGRTYRAGEVLRGAVRRIVNADAQKEARTRMERMRDEDAADAAAERMEG